jgi:hypothetical protein
MSILKLFCSQFREFVEDITLLFPQNIDIKTSIFFMNKIMEMNPVLFIRSWHEYVSIPYKVEIERGDYSFFISKDYDKDLGTSTQYESSNVIKAIGIIKKEAKDISDNNKTKIIKYLQNLTKLSIMYTDLKN